MTAMSNGDHTITHARLSDIDFCVIDTETTGGDAASNRVIDVAVMLVRDNEIIEKFHTLVNPERPIPPWITHLTGIHNGMVQEAPRFSEIVEPLQAILQKGVFTAHNAKFDYGFIQEEFRRLDRDFERPQCCTLKLARHFYPDLPSRSLGMLCEYLFIDIWDRHRAYGDAEATAYVLKDLLRKARQDYHVETWNELESLIHVGRLDLPRSLTFQDVARLPAGPGSFFFKNGNGDLVLKGQSKNVRNRIRTFFQSSNQSEKSRCLRETVHSVEVVSEN